MLAALIGSSLRQRALVLALAAVLTVLGCAALAIGTTVVEHKTLSSFRLKVATGLAAPDIALNFITAAFFVRQLVLSGQGWVAQTAAEEARGGAT